MTDDVRCQWPAWLLSSAALAAAILPEPGPWAAALLFAAATGYWSWLVCRGGSGTVAREPGGMHEPAVRSRIAESSRIASNDLRALRADLAQAGGLVRDAVETLSDSFQGIDRRMRAESEAVKARTTRMQDAGGGHLPDAPAQATAAGDSLDALVRAMQCEDVVRQLLESCDSRMEDIETYAGELAGVLSDPWLCRHPETQQARLLQACRRYIEGSARRARDRQRQIVQTSLKAGSVELF